MYYKITKNGNPVATTLTQEEAAKKFFPIIEDHSNGYIFDPEAETIYNEVDTNMIVGRKGDTVVDAGDYRFEIVEEAED